MHHGQRACVPGPAVLVFAGDVEDMRSDKRKRNFLVGVRLSEDERTALEALAASRQSSLPAFLRATGLRQRLSSSTAAISIADREELRRIPPREVGLQLTPGVPRSTHTLNLICKCNVKVKACP